MDGTPHLPTILHGWGGVASLMFPGRVQPLPFLPGVPAQKWQEIVRSLGSPPPRVVAEDSGWDVCSCPRKRAEKGCMADSLPASGQEQHGGRC